MRLRAAVAALLLAAPLHAEPLDDLFDALRMEEMLGVVRVELLGYGEGVAAQMLPEGGGPEWSSDLSELLKADLMLAQIRATVSVELSQEERDAALAFFLQPAGQSIIDAELEARHRLLGGIAAANAAQACADNAALNAAIEELSEVNDLLPGNVAGALNSDIAFFRGLVDGGYMVMSEEAIIAEVGSRAEDVRRDTSEWIMGFGCAAYQGLPSETMQAYIAFSKTDAGGALNTAYFKAFGTLYDELSYALGLAVSQRAKMSDL